MISSPQLKGEIKKQLDIRGWNYKQLGLRAGYTEDTVRTYMSCTKKQSDRFEAAVCNALGISSAYPTPMVSLSHRKED